MTSRRLKRAALPTLLLATWLGAPAQAADDGAASEEIAASEETPSEEPIDLQLLEAKRIEVALRNPMGPRVSRYLTRAQEEVDAGKVEEAERLLLKIQESRLNVLERAYVARYLGFLAYNESRPADAVEYFKQALDLQAMQVREDISMRFGIAQLYLGLSEWQKAIDWFKDAQRYTPQPDPNHFYLMALAYFQLKDYDQAIAYTEKAIELASPPKEPWLRLLSALYAQQENYEKAIPVLEELVIRYPQRAYWVQLALLYGAHDDYPTSLAAQQAAYEQGLLTESKELLRLARSFLYHEIPYSAAQVLAKGLESGRIEADQETYELLANSWISAREYDAALKPLQEAAQLSPDGKLYVRLGQVHMQREQWPEAVEMLKKAFDKGQLEHPGNAQLLLGIAYLNMDRSADARTYFQRAHEHEESRAEADRWIEHIARENQDSEQG